MEQEIALAEEKKDTVIETKEEHTQNTYDQTSKNISQDSVCVITVYIDKITDCVIFDTISKQNDYSISIKLLPTGQTFPSPAHWRQKNGKCVFDKSVAFFIPFPEFNEKSLRLSIILDNMHAPIGESNLDLNEFIYQNEPMLQKQFEMLHSKFEGTQAILHMSMFSHIYDNMKQYYQSIDLHQNTSVFLAYKNHFKRTDNSKRNYQKISYSKQSGYDHFLFCKPDNYDKMIKLKFGSDGQKLVVNDNEDKQHIFMDDTDALIDNLTVYCLTRFQRVNYRGRDIKLINTLSSIDCDFDVDIDIAFYNSDYSKRLNEADIAEILNIVETQFKQLSLPWEYKEQIFDSVVNKKVVNKNCVVIRYKVMRSGSLPLYIPFTFCGNHKILDKIKNWISDHEEVILQLRKDDYDREGSGFNVNVLKDVKPLPNIIYGPNGSHILLRDFLKPITQRFRICYHTQKEFFYFLDKTGEASEEECGKLLNLDMTRYVKIIIRYLMLQNLLKGQDNEFNIFRSFYFDPSPIKVSFAILSLILSSALTVGIVYHVISVFIERDLLNNFDEIDGLFIVLSVLVFVALSWLTRTTVSSFNEFYDKSIALFDLPWFFVFADFFTNVVIANIVCIISFFLLISSDSYGDLVLNGFALTFIMEVDDILNVFESDEDDLIEHELILFLKTNINPYTKWKKKITYEWKHVFIVAIAPFAIFISLFESIKAFGKYFVKRAHKKSD